MATATSAAFALRNGTKRTKVFDLLSDAELNTKEIAHRMNMTSNAAHDHLKALEARGLVVTDRDGGPYSPFVWRQARSPQDTQQ